MSFRLVPVHLTTFHTDKHLTKQHFGIPFFHLSCYMWCGKLPMRIVTFSISSSSYVLSDLISILRKSLTFCWCFIWNSLAVRRFEGHASFPLKDVLRFLSRCVIHSYCLLFYLGPTDGSINAVCFDVSLARVNHDLRWSWLKRTSIREHFLASVQWHFVIRVSVTTILLKIVAELYYCCLFQRCVVKSL